MSYSKGIILKYSNHLKTKGSQSQSLLSVGITLATSWARYPTKKTGTVKITTKYCTNSGLTAFVQFKMANTSFERKPISGLLLHLNVNLPTIINAIFCLSLLPPSGICAGLVSFWSLALVLLALAASIFVALCVCAVFLVWSLGLTGQSSRPAFGGRLTFVR